MRSLTHSKELEVLGFFFPEGCCRRPDTSKLLPTSLVIPNQYSRNTSYPQRAARWRHTVGARATLHYSNKKAGKIFQLHWSYCRLHVCSWHQNDAKQIKKNLSLPLPQKKTHTKTHKPKTRRHWKVWKEGKKKHWGACDKIHARGTALGGSSYYIKVTKRSRPLHTDVILTCFQEILITGIPQTPFIISASKRLRKASPT